MFYLPGKEITVETVRVSVSFYVSGTVDFSQHLDGVMNALVALEKTDPRVSDSDYEATIATSFVRINCSATATSFDEATALAMATIRAGIHAAGGFTPGWESNEYVVTGHERAEYNFVEQQLIKW
jgi:hypothetical protein